MKKVLVLTSFVSCFLFFQVLPAQAQDFAGFFADKGKISDFSARGGFRVPSRAFKPSVPKRHKDPTRDATKERRQEEQARDSGKTGFLIGLFTAFRSGSLLGLLVCLSLLYIFLRKVYYYR